MESCFSRVCTQQNKFIILRKKFLSKWRRFKENLIYKIAACILSQNKIILFSSLSNDKFGNITALAKTLHNYKTPFILLTCEYLKYNHIRSLIILARARILVIDAASPSARLKLNSNTCLIHCWHACGAYKKIGFDAKRKNFSDQNEEKRIKRIHRGISWFVCTSKETAKIYAKAFRIPVSRMLVFGSPRIDEIVKKKNFVSPKIYTILYAPTFRTQGNNNRYLPPLPDAKKIRKILNSRLGEDINLVFRGHPTTQPPKNLNGWVDWSNIPQYDALEKTSVLITDYSSIFFDFLIFKRPIVFFVPDLYIYQNNERELYFSPYKYFSETTCIDETSLIKILIKCRNLRVDYSEIWNKYMSACNGNSTELLYKFIKNIISKEV